MSDKKTPQEIEALKQNWLNDPCWDIEDTEGFEAHHEELLAFKNEQEERWDEERGKRIAARREKVLEVTGVSSADHNILDSLSIWSEIINNTERQDAYMGDFSTREAIVMAELAQEQIRATLLQAAQLKRIADALERMEDGESLETTVRIWGSEL